jgi:uncharacterized protein (DUF1015 family)
MAELRGFKGLHFNKRLVGSLDRVVTPPFDVISPEERDHLASRSPYNMVTLILPKEAEGRTRYEVAQQHLADWLARGVLRQDPEESFYLLEQTFRGIDGVERVRRGFLGITKLPEKGENTVLGHENTFEGPVEDRLRLTEATRANLSPVMVLYSDPRQEIASFFQPIYDRPEDDCAYTFDRVTQRLWRVPHSPTVADFFRDKKLYLADGHHRFKTACAYRDRMRQMEGSVGLRPYDFVLMGFIPLEDSGLVIYSPHRLLDRPPEFAPKIFLAALEKWFEVTPVPDDPLARTEAEPGCVIGMAIHGAGQYLLKLRIDQRDALLGRNHSRAWQDLDVAVLHRGVLKQILGLPEAVKLTYEVDASKAAEAVSTGRKGLAFFLRPIRPDTVKACAEAGDPMPQKSTYFFPKLPAGLAIYRHE